MHTPTRNALLSALLLTTIMATPAQARVNLDVFVGTAPPAPYVEYVQEPRYGYAWAPGHWEWNGRRYVWAQGSWIEDRPGFVWEPDHWAHVGSRWQYVHGDWRQGDPHKYANYYQHVRWGDKQHWNRWEDRRDNHDNGRHNGWDNHDRHDNDRHDNDRNNDRNGNFRDWNGRHGH